MFRWFALADVPETKVDITTPECASDHCQWHGCTCRPDDFPPFDGELTADDDASSEVWTTTPEGIPVLDIEKTIERSIHDEEVAMAREATLFPATASPWVRRAQMRDLPVFDGTGGGHFAYDHR